MHSDLHDIEVIFVHATERGVCVRPEEGGAEIWLALAQCEIAPLPGHSLQRGKPAMLTAPESLLTEKGAGLMGDLKYSDGGAVELFDHVELRLDGKSFEGQVTKLLRKLYRVRVGYADFINTRRDGEGVWRSAEVPVADIDLIRRDG